MRYKSPITQPGFRQGLPSPNKGKKFPAEILEPDEVLALIDACNCGPSGLRDRAVITTLWRTGIRVGELSALRTVDIDLERGAIRVRGTKSDCSDRTVGMDREGCAVLRDWLDVRAEELCPPRLSPAFCCVSRHELGNPLKPQQIRQKLRMLADRCGIEKRVHPHCLRHTHAAELATEGVNLRIIQLQLGHSNVSITHRYVNHLNPVAVIDTMAERRWAA